MFPVKRGTNQQGLLNGGLLNPSWVSRGLVLVIWNGLWITPRGTRAMTPVNSPGRRTGPEGPVTGFGTTDAGNTTARFNGFQLMNSQSGPRSYFGTVLARSAGGGGLGRLWQDASGAGGATVGEEAVYFVASRLTLTKVNSSGGSLQVSATQTLPIGSWCSFGFSCRFVPNGTVAGDDITTFINGERDPRFINNNSGGSYPANSFTDFRIGNRQTDNARTWDGQVGIVAVFDSFLSDQDHKSLSANPYQLFASSTAYAPAALPVVTEAVFPFRRGDFTSQPPTAQTVAHQTLSKGLAFVYSAQHGFGEVLSRGQVPILVRNAVKDSGRGGSSYRATNGGVPISWNLRPVVTHNGLGTGDFTLVYHGDPVNNTVRRVMVAQDVNFNNNNYTCLIANAGSDAGLTASSGSVSFVLYNDVDGVVGVTAASSCDGRPHTWIGLRRGTRLELWRDGLLVASTTAGVAVNVLDSSQGIAVGGFAAFPGFNSDANNYAAYTYNRALTTTEAALLSTKPYAIFDKLKGSFAANLVAGATQYIKDLVSSLSISGAITKSTSKSFGGSLTLAGALAATKTFIRALGGSITAAGSLSKSTAKNVAGSITKVGSVIKSTAKAFTGSTTVSATPVVGMGASANLSGSITLSSVLSDAVTFVRNYGSQIVLSGGMAKAISKLVGGSISMVGNAFKGMYKVLTSSITMSSIVSGFKFTPEEGGALARGLRFMRRFIGRR